MFGIKRRSSHWVLERDLIFQAGPYVDDVLAMHQVTPRAGRGVVGADGYDQHVGIELQFDRNGAFDAAAVHGGSDIIDYVRETVEAGTRGTQLKAPRTKPNVHHAGDFWDKGKSRLGGVPPSGLVMPPTGLPTGYHYAGTLNRAALGIPIGTLRRDVHLIWPFLESYQAPLFLDVADPLQPKVLPAEKSAVIRAHRPPGQERRYEPTVEGPVLGDAAVPSDLHVELEFEEDRFSMVPTKDFVWDPSVAVRGGVPRWEQVPTIPLCPGSGRPMRFLCQIMGGTALTEASRTRLQQAKGVPQIDRMHWWSDGTLYVFAAPGEDVICLMVQNS